MLATLLSLGIIFVTYALPVQAKRIILGNLVSSQSPLQKYTVAVSVFDEDGTPTGFCTGVIVSRNFILTAGHCLTQNNMKVKIGFGLGGPAKFTHIVDGNGFKSSFPITSGSSGSAWVNGVLAYDEENRSDFLETVNERMTWFTFQDFGVSEASFNDIALIKIASLPPGYEPVQIHKGKLKFKQDVFVAGYGTNSRQQKEINNSLRWSKLKIIGHYTRLKNSIKGWQIYSPEGRGVCFGDSGGPMFVSVNGKYELLGTNLFVLNKCANSSFTTNINFFKKWIESSAAALGGSVEI